MNKEEKEESPYCEICGHCGDIGCCGISNFIDKHIKGKTNCKHEKNIINELEDLCDYQTETFKENEHFQSQLDIANKKIEKYQKLEQQLSQLQQENQKLNDSINQSNLAKINALMKAEQLQQENENLRKTIKNHVKYIF